MAPPPTQSNILSNIIPSVIRLVITSLAVAKSLDPEADQICEPFLLSHPARTKRDTNTRRQVVITEYLYWAMIECGVGIIAACVPTFLFSLIKVLCPIDLPVHLERGRARMETAMPMRRCEICIIIVGK